MTGQARVMAESRLTELRRDRGAARLDGRKFDNGAIATAEAELASVDDAAGVSATREREEAERQRQKHRTELRGTLAEQESNLMGELHAADVAAHAAVEAIGKVLQISVEMTRTAHAISGGPVPTPLHGSDVASRLGGRLAALLSTIPGHPLRLGGVEWRGGSLYRADDDWRAAEAKILEAHLRPFIEEG